MKAAALKIQSGVRTALLSEKMLNESDIIRNEASARDSCRGRYAYGGHRSAPSCLICLHALGNQSVTRLELIGIVQSTYLRAASKAVRRGKDCLKGTQFVPRLTEEIHTLRRIAASAAKLISHEMVKPVGILLDEGVFIDGRLEKHSIGLRVRLNPATQSERNRQYGEYPSHLLPPHKLGLERPRINGLGTGRDLEIKHLVNRVSHHVAIDRAYDSRIRP